MIYYDAEAHSTDTLESNAKGLYTRASASTREEAIAKIVTFLKVFPKNIRPDNFTLGTCSETAEKRPSGLPNFTIDKLEIIYIDPNTLHIFTEEENSARFILDAIKDYREDPSYKGKYMVLVPEDGSLDLYFAPRKTTVKNPSVTLERLHSYIDAHIDKAYLKKGLKKLHVTYSTRMGENDND